MAGHPVPLKSAPPRIGAAPVRIAPSVDGTEAARHRRRDAEQPWRAWYKTARWQRLKREVHARDGYVCQRTGTLCIGRYPAGNSPVGDHKVSPADVWRETGDLDAVAACFWDPDNVETVSKDFHDGARQSEQRRARRL